MAGAYSRPGVSMRNFRAALTATIDTIRMGIRLWRTAKKRERVGPNARPRVS